MNTRKNPFREIERLIERMSTEFEEAARPFEETPFGPQSHGGSIDVDVAERDDEYVVTADLPGFSVADLDVRVADGRLDVRAEREETVERSDADFLRRERSRQTVSRTVELPGPVVADDASATYRRGVLSVTLPKADAEDRGHRIDIE